MSRVTGAAYPTGRRLAGVLTATGIVAAHGVRFAYAIHSQLRPTARPAVALRGRELLDDTLHNAHILIVDDQILNVRLLEGILQRAGYANTRGVTDPRMVVQYCQAQEPDLICLDLMMPFLDGYQVMEQIRPLTPSGSYLPILVLTADITPEAKRRALSMGAKDFLAKPFDSTEVLLRIRNLLETRYFYLQLQGQNKSLEQKVRARTFELEQAQHEILERLARAAEYRDDETGKHTQRVSSMAALIARILEVPAGDVELIRKAVPLHDVGKIGVPDAIFLKPGKLTPEEFEVVKTHPTIGAALLSGGHSPLVVMAELIAGGHHERWDGSGYPRGLAGEEIPLAARIVAVADVFDALTHKRPYKEAWPVEEAIEEIKRQSGRHFDPRVVEAFLVVIERGGLNGELED